MIICRTGPSWKLKEKGNNVKMAHSKSTTTMIIKVIVIMIMIMIMIMIVIVIMIMIMIMIMVIVMKQTNKQSKKISMREFLKNCGLKSYK